jgi:NAD(P)-dependent dehydrogenase (short-subunit alcohol dehydrogenase family)
MATTESRQPQHVSGQVVVVTGGAGVIGRAICEAFGRAGAFVAVADLVEGPRDATVAAIRQAGGRARGIQLDVTDRAMVDAMVETVERELGPIDLLVNCAGHIGAIGPIWEIDPDLWWRAYEVNVRGVMLCSRAVLIGMVARRRGRIINLSSGSALGASQAFSAYPSSKTAVTRLTEHMAADAREYGVSVFAITPGMVHTPLAQAILDSAWTPQYREPFEQRHVPPELAADRCVAIATGRADRLTGCFIQLTDDLDELARRADEIAAGGLYTLRILGENATPITPRVVGR